MELILRVTFSLLVVFGLMWFLARLARRSGLRGKDDGALTVLDRRQLTKNSAVAIVGIAGRAYILGVTDAQVSLLGEADLSALRGGRDMAERDGQAETVRRTAVPVQAQPVGAGTGSLETIAVGPGGRLAGSALSPRTWATAVEVLRARTVRKQ